MAQNESELLERITRNPKVKVGKPVIRGTRLNVEFILGLMAYGMTIDEILVEYTHISRSDVLACIHYGEKAISENLFFPSRAGV